jgi:hypothetical protein
MKKLILLILLLPLTSIFSQTLWWVDPTILNAEKKIFLGEIEISKLAPNGKDSIRFAPLPVSIVGGASITITSTADTNLTNLLKPHNKELAYNGLTVSTETDSIAVTAGITRYSFDIISVEDTMEFSFTSAFTNPRRLMPSQSKYLENISAATFPKIYIRRKGIAGTGIYDFDLIGY